MTDYNKRADEMCAALEAVDDKLTQMSLEELGDLGNDPDVPQENDEDEDGKGKSKRSWLGKVGKGLYKRGSALGRSMGVLSEKLSQEDEDALALVQSCRAPYAYTSGGVAAQNPDDAKACRSVLSLMVRQMGRTLLQGGNVMSVSLPIQCCQPRTILEVAGAQPGYAQHFLPRAAAATDPVERLKYVIATFVSGMALTSNNFLKPLNPILGETLQSEFSDGSCLFMEQTCHHPPVSSFHYVGPGEQYVYYGFSEFGVGFGVNRMFLQSGGMRVVEFPDGGRVEIGFPDNVIKNVFWGDMHHVVFGSQSFTDKKNGVRCTITFDPEHRRGLPSDYFEGTVERFDPAKPEDDGEALCEVVGTWVGFIDFDKVRYWDVRSCQKMTSSPPVALLPSDSRRRADSVALQAKDFKKAQAAKLMLEEVQRKERKQRETLHGVKGRK